MADIHYIPYVYQTVITTVVGAIWWSYKNMQSRLLNTLTKEEVRVLIEDKLESVQADIENLKTQITRIDSNVLKLLEFQITHGK